MSLQGDVLAVRLPQDVGGRRTGWRPGVPGTDTAVPGRVSPRARGRKCIASTRRRLGPHRARGSTRSSQQRPPVRPASHVSAVPGPFAVSRRGRRHLPVVRRVRSRRQQRPGRNRRPWAAGRVSRRQPASPRRDRRPAAAIGVHSPRMNGAHGAHTTDSAGETPIPASGRRARRMDADCVQETPLLAGGHWERPRDEARGRETPLPAVSRRPEPGDAGSAGPAVAGTDPEVCSLRSGSPGPFPGRNRRGRAFGALGGGHARALLMGP